MDNSRVDTKPTIVTENYKIDFTKRSTFIKESISPEIRGIKRILNKITGNDSLKYEGYRDAILGIEILKDDSEEKDFEIMKPIVLCFLAMVFEDTEYNNIIEVYSKLFTEIVNKWKGRQGNVLLSCTIKEIQEFLFNKYTITKEIDIVERRKCFCIVKFLHYLYNMENSVIPGKIIMIILEKFYNEDEKMLEIFLRILQQNYKKLITEKIFVSKLKSKYATFLQTCKDKSFTSKKFNYEIENTAKLFEV
jgi:hypothetical protein